MIRLTEIEPRPRIRPGLLLWKEMRDVPKRPNKPCSYPGCPRLVPAKETYCSEHYKQMNQEYERFGRDPRTKRRYGRAWKRIRDRYASQHPLCEMCLAEGKATETEEVHHIVPLRDGGTHAESNLMALCKSCHSRVHAERGDRWNRDKKDCKK